MKAVQVSGPSSVHLTELPEPKASPGEVLVSVERAAMCATDRKLTRRGADPPRVPGHEIVGRVEDGGVVGIHPDIGCGTCAFCRVGFENRCPDRVSIGLDRDGGFAQMVAAPASHVVRLDIEPEVGPLLEPLACCIHAVEMLGVRRDDLAMVVGAGPMGLLAMWALQARGADVAVVQRSEERRRLAAKLGATLVLGPQDDVAETLGRQPRVAIVTAPRADALDLAMENVSPGGVVHAFAGTPGGAWVDANKIHYRHLSLVGSTGSNLSDYERGLNLVRQGRVPLHRLPTSTIPLEGVPGVLRGDTAPDALKILVDVKGS